MRDIRKDLQDRLKTIETEQSDLEKRMSALDQEKSLTCQMLEMENTRWQKQTTKGQAEAPQKGSLGLAGYIAQLLADGQIWKLNVIRERALSDGYLGDSTFPGRSVHASLVNLKKQGHVEQLGDGKWKKATAPKTGDALGAVQDLLS